MAKKLVATLRFDQCTLMEKKLYQILLKKANQRYSTSSFDTHNTLMIMTPQPYIILNRHHHDPFKMYRDIQLLYAILKLMDISKSRAIIEEYTLNIDTERRLSAIALDTDNHPALVLINSRSW